ncbi:MAG: hypothetical protein FWG36_00920 [Oscillospiraceae bacterium]|nr:hypothetical protein [Oscillospiraceae bacterium]
MNEGNEHTPRKKRAFLIFYSVALFSAAAVIILLSYLYSSRMERSEEELEESRRVSLSAMQSVENLMDDNRTLTNKLAAAEESISTLKLELEEGNKKTNELYNTGEIINNNLIYYREKLTELIRLYNELIDHLPNDEGENTELERIQKLIQELLAEE